MVIGSKDLIPKHIDVEIAITGVAESAHLKAKLLLLNKLPRERS